MVNYYKTNTNLKKQTFTKKYFWMGGWKRSSKAGVCPTSPVQGGPRRKAYEFAVVVYVSKPIREATYLLEGDGVLALFAKDILDYTASEFALRVPSMDFTNVQIMIFF